MIELQPMSADYYFGPGPIPGPDAGIALTEGELAHCLDSDDNRYLCSHILIPGIVMVRWKFDLTAHRNPRKLSFWHEGYTLWSRTDMPRTGIGAWVPAEGSWGYVPDGFHENGFDTILSYTVPVPTSAIDDDGFVWIHATSSFVPSPPPPPPGTLSQYTDQVGVSVVDERVAAAGNIFGQRFRAFGTNIERLDSPGASWESGAALDYPGADIECLPDGRLHVVGLDVDRAIVHAYSRDDGDSWEVT